MKSFRFKTMALAAVAALACAAQAPRLDAFPGAEGAGRYSLGGRGGAVIKVTNLNDAGPGSLRAAVEARGPRTVIFDISGTIALKSPLRITEPRLTIAGQTAPGDGITLRDQPLVVSAGDVVIRYIRARLGSASGVQEDAVWVRRGRRIILDHLSASWSVDETLSVSERYASREAGPQDVTVQWCIIAESLNKSVHDKGKHGYGSLVRGGMGSQFSFHHNLWASHEARMPRPGNYAEAKDDPEGAFFDFRNNVFYNWAGEASGYNADTNSNAVYNFVANAYVAGPNSTGAKAFKEQNILARSWFEANAMNGQVPADPWSLVTGIHGNRLPGPLPMPAVRTETWQAAYARVLASAGASYVRDAVDKRIISGVADRSHRIIDTEADVGGWPVLVSKVPPVDSDGDGMPDPYERSRGLNSADPVDGARTAAGGYTNLEIYLNGFLPS